MLFFLQKNAYFSLQIWITKIKRDPSKDFKTSRHTKVCSAHFCDEDFINPDSLKRRLKPDALPAAHGKKVKTRSLPEKFKQIKQQEDLLKQEETATASEGEGTFEVTDKEGIVSRSIQVNIPLPCSHRLSLQLLRDQCDTQKKEEKYLKHYTGFKSYEKIVTILNFVLPESDGKSVVYWGTKAGKNRAINAPLLFDTDDQLCDSDSDSTCSDVEDESSVGALRKRALCVEDEFFLFLVKVRLGLTNLDIAIRFCLAESTVTNIFITWLNLLFLRLGSLKIWPHRNVILQHMPDKFKDDYPNNIIIIDATELRIQCPSSLVLQSQSYSSYKSANTLKSLIGVDAKGGFVYVSQLYTGSISDKEIVKRSGFLDVLARKKNAEEIKVGDSIMADKGFDIH